MNFSLETDTSVKFFWSPVVHKPLTHMVVYAKQKDLLASYSPALQKYLQFSDSIMSEIDMHTMKTWGLISKWCISTHPRYRQSPIIEKSALVL